MIKGIAILLLFQLLGESLVFTTQLPLPGPVVGLVFFFVAMQACKVLGFSVFTETETAADGFLANLGLLFVPAGVGIVALWGQLQSQAAILLVILVTSAIFTLATTVWTFIAVRRLVWRGQPE
ncbi:MAG: CidA/LrgA family protein [Shinella sp.]|uniref:CidA/LrgA family protein n=1 Tax=Shinella sp. TaxID=1870904 RepID=UPI003C725BC7